MRSCILCSEKKKADCLGSKAQSSAQVFEQKVCVYGGAIQFQRIGFVCSDTVI